MVRPGVDIPEPQGGKRPPVIPVVRDRVARQAAKIVLEPICEADFAPCSSGFLPKRPATMAMERLRTGFIGGCQFAAEFGIRNFFGEVDHDRLLAEVGRRVSDRRVLELVRYADDDVVLCRSAAQARATLDAVGEILASLGLELHPDKTKEVVYLHRWRSQRAMNRLRDKVRARTGSNRGGNDIREVIADLNPLPRGWGNYFRTGTAPAKFRQADDYVVKRLRKLMIRKRGRNLRPGQRLEWNEDWFNGHGLYRLRGTIRYAKAA